MHSDHPILSRRSIFICTCLYIRTVYNYHKPIFCTIKLLLYKRIENGRQWEGSFNGGGKRRPSERRCIVQTTTTTDRRPSRQGGKFILRGVISTCVMRCAFSRRWKFLTFFGHRNIPTAVDDAWHRGSHRLFSTPPVCLLSTHLLLHFPVLLAPGDFASIVHNTLCHSRQIPLFFFPLLRLLLGPRFSNFVRPRAIFQRGRRGLASSSFPDLVTNDLHGRGEDSRYWNVLLISYIIPPPPPPPLHPRNNPACRKLKL